MSITRKQAEELHKALADLLDCIADSDQRPPGEVTKMRMVGIISDKKTHAAIDRARQALARGTNE